MIHEGEGTGLIYKRELCSCCWSGVKLSDCFQFHASCSRQAWNTAVFSHKLRSSILAVHSQQYRRCSGSPKPLSEPIQSEEGQAAVWGMRRWIACRTRSSAAPDVCGLSSLMGAKADLPFLCEMRVLLWALWAVVCALMDMVSFGCILLCEPVLMTAIITTKWVILRQHLSVLVQLDFWLSVQSISRLWINPGS